jgi:MFS family permease
MQPTAEATVIAFGPKRRAVRASGRRRAVARGIVSVWLGAAALAILLLVGQLVAVLLRHGVAGIGIGLAVVSAAGWPLAGRLLTRGSPPQRKRPISRRPRHVGLKSSPKTAEAKDTDI